MLVPRQHRGQGVEELCPSGGRNLIFEVICPFHGSFALEGLVWKKVNPRTRQGSQWGLSTPRVWGWGVKEIPRAALGVVIETIGDFWWIAELFLAGNGRNAACVSRFQRQELNLGPWNLKPETFMGSLRFLF